MTEDESNEVIVTFLNVTLPTIQATKVQSAVQSLSIADDVEEYGLSLIYQSDWVSDDKIYEQCTWDHKSMGTGTEGADQAKHEEGGPAVTNGSFHPDPERATLAHRRYK